MNGSELLLMNKDVLVYHTIPLLIALFVIYRMIYLRHKVGCTTTIVSGVILSVIYISLQFDFVSSATDSFIKYEYVDLNSVLFSFWEAVILLAYERAVTFCVPMGTYDPLSNCRCRLRVTHDSVLSYEDGKGVIEEHLRKPDQEV